MRASDGGKVPRLVLSLPGPCPSTSVVIPHTPPSPIGTAYRALCRTARHTPCATHVRVEAVPCGRGTQVTVSPSIDHARAWLVGQCLVSWAAARGRRHPRVALASAARALATLASRDALGTYIVTRTLLQCVHVDRRHSKGLGTWTFPTVVAFAALVPLDGPAAADRWRAFLQPGDPHGWTSLGAEAAATGLAAAAAAAHAGHAADTDRVRTLVEQGGPWDVVHVQALYRWTCTVLAAHPTTVDLAHRIVADIRMRTPRRPPRAVRGRPTQTVAAAAATFSSSSSSSSPLEEVVYAALRGTERPPGPSRYAKDGDPHRFPCPVAPVPWSRVWVSRPLHCGGGGGVGGGGVGGGAGGGAGGGGAGAGS